MIGIVIYNTCGTSIQDIRGTSELLRWNVINKTGESLGPSVLIFKSMSKDYKYNLV